MRVPLPAIERIPGGRAYAALSRRVRTLIVAGVLFIVLFVLVLSLPVPYRVLSPGPTCNTLDVCEINNGSYQVIKFVGFKPVPVTGHLNLTTVSVTNQRVNAFQAIEGWLDSDEVVIPETAVQPPGTTQQQADRQNTRDFIGSQEKATAAALCEMHFPKAFGVLSVLSKGPSDGVLAPGDALVSVDGQAANSATKLTAVMSKETPGKTVPVVVRRQTGTDRQPVTQTLNVTLGKAPKGRTGALLGVTVTVGVGCLAPFTIDLGLGNQIGGPSAGLMLALGIIDEVGLLGDLTGGKFIAGTGEISPKGEPQGSVGPIGGIALKMIAARNKGATVFLAPAGNCGDVRNANVPAGLQVVKVDTLHHAVEYLKDLQQGKPVPTC